MLGIDEDDDCDPAIQIEHLYSIRVAAEECSVKDAKPRLGQTAPKKAASVSMFYYHPPTRRLFVGLDDGELRFWKLASDGSGSCYAVGSHKGAISSICIPAPTDGDLGAAGLILSGSYDATVKIWDYQGKIKLSPTISVQTLYGHGGTITCMVTNGEYLITGSTDCTIRIWKSADGRRELTYPWLEMQSTLVSMEGWVRCMVFSRPADVASEDLLFAADDTGAIIKVVMEGVVDQETCRVGKDKEFKIVGKVSAANGTLLAFRRMHDRGILAISHDYATGLLFTLAYDNGLRVYDTSTSSLRHCWINENNCLFSGMQFDAASKQIVTVDQQGFMAVYSLARDALIATKRLATFPQLGLVQCIGPDTYAVASSSQIQIWKIERDLEYDMVRGGHTKDVIALYACSGGVGLKKGEMDYRVFSASIDNTIRLWDPYDMTCLRILEEEYSEISAMTFFEGWNIVVTGHDNGDVRLWNMDTGSCTTLKEHTNTVSALLMAIVRRNEELLISACYDGFLCVWDVRSMKFQKPCLVQRVQVSRTIGAKELTALERLKLRTEILCVEYDPYKKLILTGGSDGKIKAHSTASMEVVCYHSGHTDSVTCMTMDGNFLFSGSEDTTVRMWDTMPAYAESTQLFITQPLLILRGHEKCVTGIKVLRTSGHLVSCSINGQLRVWNYVTGQTIHECRHHEQFRCLTVRYDKEEVLVGTAEANILQFPVELLMGEQ